MFEFLFPDFRSVVALKIATIIFFVHWLEKPQKERQSKANALIVSETGFVDWTSRPCFVCLMKPRIFPFLCRRYCSARLFSSATPKFYGGCSLIPYSETPPCTLFCVWFKSNSLIEGALKLAGVEKPPSGVHFKTELIFCTFANAAFNFSNHIF